MATPDYIGILDNIVDEFDLDVNDLVDGVGADDKLDDVDVDNLDDIFDQIADNFDKIVNNGGLFGGGNSEDPSNDSDRILGNNDDEEIDALKGNDAVNGDDGDDSLIGNDGDDLLYGNDGEDKLLGGKGNDWMLGGNDNDLLKGLNDRDVLAGMDGDDTLIGGRGDDFLVGGSGDDLLDGQSGNDTLVGGDDSDIFALSKGDGIARIKDFADGEDSLGLQKGKFGDLSFVQKSDDVNVKFGDELVAKVLDTKAKDFTKADVVSL